MIKGSDTNNFSLDIIVVEFIIKPLKIKLDLNFTINLLQKR